MYLYTAHGRLAWDEFMEQPVSQRAAEEGLDITLVPPENLFFISLEYWDYMMQIVQNKLATIKEILLKTRECCNSSDPSKKKILMDMVLMEYFRVPQMKLSYLTDAHSLLDYTDKIHD